MSIASAARPMPVSLTICRQCLSRLRKQSNSSSLTFAHTKTRRLLSNVSATKSDDNGLNVPRWAATPRAMRAPFRSRPKSDNDEFPVNADPKRLDSAYVKLLGPGGDQWLDETTKWLAVTHKSFDHGRRGYNERLAFLGKRKIELQASLALLEQRNSPEKVEARKRKDAYGRSPFLDPTLEGIQNVSIYEKTQLLDDRRLSQLGSHYGLADVVRWKPRQVRDLHTSGLDAVLATTMYAIAGAVALQKGGAVANKMIRERILNPLGVK